MKSVIKNICQTIQSIFHFCIWIIKLIIRKNFRNYIKKDCHTENVYILGNGPSLNLALEKINDATNTKICVVNFAILSPLFKKIKPHYYVVADPLFFNRPINDKRIIQTIQELNKVDWNLTMFIPYTYYKKYKLEITSSYIHIIPFNTNAFHENMTFKNLKYYIYKKGLACPRVQNVIIACIYCMINSGYKNIYLYGVEHSWTEQLLVNDNNQVCLKDIHFYDKDEVKITPWMKGPNEAFKMHEILRTLSYMFIGYHDLQDYANYLGDVNIVNKTKKSFIDAFKKEL